MREYRQQVTRLRNICSSLVKLHVTVGASSPAEQLSLYIVARYSRKDMNQLCSKSLDLKLIILNRSEIISIIRRTTNRTQQVIVQVSSYWFNHLHVAWFRDNYQLFMSTMKLQINGTGSARPEGGFGAHPGEVGCLQQQQQQNCIKPPWGKLYYSLHIVFSHLAGS